MRNLLDGIPPLRLAWYAVGVALLLVALLGSCGCAPVLPEVWMGGDEEPVNRPAGTKRVNVAWAPPCLGPEPPCGGPWTHYVLDLRKGNTPWTFELATPDTTAQLILSPGTWRARVAAVNDTIQGPYSDPSDPLRIPVPDVDRRNIHREESR